MLNEKLVKILDNTVRDKDCLLWQGALSDRGYPLIYHDGKTRRTHRVSFYLFHGHIDDDCVIHHICANRSCINPDHLQAITAQENTAEMLERNNYKKKISKLEKENNYLKKLLRKAKVNVK